MWKERTAEDAGFDSH